jgi:hypothetical protein
MPELNGRHYPYTDAGMAQFTKDRQAKIKRREARPRRMTAEERQTIESGTLPTSKKTMRRHQSPYADFGNQENAAERGELAAQRALRGAGQNIIPGPQIDDVPPSGKNLEPFRRALDSMRLQQPQQVGPLAGRFSRLVRELAPTQQSAPQGLMQLNQQVMRMLAGAQMSNREAARIKKQVPQAGSQELMQLIEQLKRESSEATTRVDPHFFGPNQPFGVERRRR